MASLNKVIIMGILTRNPDLKRTGSGTAVCEIGLALNRKGTGKAKDEVCFVDVVVWGKTAESCGKYLSKGSTAMFEGRLSLEQWTDSASGARRSRMKVIAESVQFISSSGKADNSRQSPDSGENGKSSGTPEQFNENDYPDGENFDDVRF
ncbi:MAG: single-stranded DNA-binding protein [Lentisphaerota bacterium]